ncbi:myb-like protein A isoform X3 [Sipha flava]|uniref:Mediator of DNA damage checkpoint protein 1 n=1 Tax=Sipha flava TaxID=143950 RepID=A0A8B8FB49_9HEMI|nr:myb-like protein A isoform X3 [Sipha flava]
MDEDSPWLCTQAMHDCVDDHPIDRNDKANSFGCIVLNNVDDNECYVLNEGDNTIGRHPLNHIYIEHPSVSMNHAVIQCDSDGVVLLDKGSLNKTKLNKKPLKKNVAYFLEENACLMFGEIKANYYVDGKPTEAPKEVKAIVSNGTSLENIMENHAFSAPQLPCAGNTINMLCNKEKTDKVSGNNSTDKTEMITLKTITQSECVHNKHDDVYLESNHSSPSDAFLLDAVSQIESQLLPEIVQEESLSPVMDFGNSLSNINNLSSNVFQIPNKMNSNETRDETPSPVMDLGLKENYELLTPVTNCHTRPLVNEITNNIDNLNETQCLVIDNNVKESKSPYSLLNLKNEKDFTINNDLFNFTQDPSDTIKPCEASLSNSKSCNIGPHEDLAQKPDVDDDFFNCPTQKLSVSKCSSSIPKLSSNVHEEETQGPSETIKSYEAGLSHSKSYNISPHEDFAKKPDMDDDFFNCPTQKVSIATTILSTKNLSSKHEQETQKRSEFVCPNINDSSYIKNSSSGVYRDLTETSDLNNEDFFNCPTQKLSHSIESKTSTVQKSTRMPFSKNNSPDNSKKQNKENVHKISNENFSSSSSIHENENNNFLVDTNSENKSVKQKRTVLLNNTEECLIRNSMCLESNSNNKSKYTHSSVISNENKYSYKNLKTKKKPIIRVKKDLHKSSSASLSNNSLHNTNIISDDVTEPAKKNINSFTCSKIENERRKSSIKQEHFSDDSMDFQNFNSPSNKSLSKQNNETIFSPLNIPSLNENVIQQQSTPIDLETNSISVHCEPSCSNTAVTKWKLFWNKKKLACENKGKSCKQENVNFSNADKIKNRYQTRALVKRENATENDKKRKQNTVNVEDKNKRLCYEDRENILNPLIPSTVVVTFSFLKSRHLQELKKFIETTGGCVTDEITQCTVLVTDKIRCTMKILSAIAKGCPIVNPNWIKHSYTVKNFQDVDEFLIVDKDAERKYKFQLKESLARAKTSRLLEGYTVLVTPSVKPGLKDMKVIITCAGGNFTVNWPIQRVQKELIVTCDQDRRRWKSIWNNSTAKIIDSDTFVMSIIRQKLNV